jgi:copper chaperone CopZ
MHCDKCAATVERLIKGLPQVQRVSVDYPAAHAVVTHSGGLDLAALQAAVAEDGYSLSRRA